MTYTVAIENLRKNYPAMEHIYRMHYATMQERLAASGVQMSDYNPRKEQYFSSNEAGHLLHFVLRSEGEIVGYANIYLTNDMHNNDFIAQEDTIYVVPQHRNGSGRLLARFVHQELKARGVKRLNVTTATDLVVSKWLARQGYVHAAHCMTLVF